VFRDAVAARHVVYAYSLLKAVERAKQQIAKIPEQSRTDAQKKHARFFSARGSTHLLVSAIGAAIETILGRAVADRYALRFVQNLSPAAAMEKWQPVVDVALAFSGQLQAATDQGLKAEERVATAHSDFGAMIEATRTFNAETFDQFAAGTFPSATHGSGASS
jgi:hypothetical protein